MSIAFLLHLPTESRNAIDNGLDSVEVVITCVARRLVVRSTDDVAMSKSLRQHGLVPAASIVVKISDNFTSNLSTNSSSVSSTKLTDRVASKKKLKKGTHTMQSIGVYSTEDNAKGELIDGGGGTWYEHDVDDDEEDMKKEQESSSTAQAECDDIQNSDVVNKDALDETSDEDLETR